MHKHIHTRSTLTLILASSLTAECLMTLRGGIGESSRYNMLDGIQAFSIRRARWKTICIFIHSGCVRSHKQQQKLRSADCSSRIYMLSVYCCSHFAFSFHANFVLQTLSFRHGARTGLQSYMSYLSKCLSINASDLLALAPLTLTETARARKQKWSQLYAYCWLITSSTLYLEDLAVCGITLFTYLFILTYNTVASENKKR